MDGVAGLLFKVGLVGLVATWVGAFFAVVFFMDEVSDRFLRGVLWAIGGFSVAGILGGILYAFQ